MSICPPASISFEKAFVKKIGFESSGWGCGGGLESWALGVVLFSPFALFGLVLGLGVWVGSLVWVGVCMGGVVGVLIFGPFFVVAGLSVRWCLSPIVC